MKVLLIRPPYAYADFSLGLIPLGFFCTFLTRYPPLGMMYLAAILRRAGHEVILLDAEAEELDTPSVIERVRPFGPKVILSSINIYNSIQNFNDVFTLKEALNVPLIVRGHFPLLYPAESIARERVDVVMTGKGFGNVHTLIEAMSTGSDLAKVPGILFRRNGEIVDTGPEPHIKHMDDLPFPARDLIDKQLYATNLSYRMPLTTMFASLGCPYNCPYCTDSIVPYMHRSAENVVNEMIECVRRFGYREITFLDPTFTVSRDWTAEVCQRLIDSGVDVSFTMRTRPELLDEELVRLLSRAGCVRISLGIESGDPQMLGELGRSKDLDHMRRAASWIHEAGIMGFGYFMIGNRHETNESLARTLAYVKTLPLHFAQFFQVIPLPNTIALESYKRKFGVDLWREINEGRFPHPENFREHDNALSLADIRRWSRKFFTAFYFQPQRLLRVIRLRYWGGYFLRQFEIAGVVVKLLLLRRLRRRWPRFLLKVYPHVANGGPGDGGHVH